MTDGYSLAYGARFLKRVIESKIKLPISQRWTEGTSFVADVVDGQVEIQVVGGRRPAIRRSPRPPSERQIRKCPDVDDQFPIPDFPVLASGVASWRSAGVVVGLASTRRRACSHARGAP